MLDMDAATNVGKGRAGGERKMSDVARAGQASGRPGNDEPRVGEGTPRAHDAGSGDDRGPLVPADGSM